MSTLASVIAPIAITFLAIIALRRLSWHEQRKFPGPKPLPIIGNIHQYPKGDMHLTWAEWGKKYGPIIQVKALSQKMLVINSHHVATKLLSEKGQIYSGRPFLPMACGQCGWDQSFAFMDPGRIFKETRKMLHRALEGKMVDKFANHVQAELNKFVYHLYVDPENFQNHIRTTSAAVVLLISHGYVIGPRHHEDPFVVLAEETNRITGIVTEPGQWLIDFLPILKHLPAWFPGAKFKRLAKGYKATLERFVDEPHERVKGDMRKGTALYSCTRMLLEESGDSEDYEREKIIKWGMAMLFRAGSDTSASVSATFFLAMACNPEVLKLAQEELDDVVGPDRVPVWEDRPKLPYIEAIMTEVLRYAPPAPTGVPHKATEDGIYDGCIIKKGTMIFTNIWGMMHDEAVFPNPGVFSPERYLEKLGNKETGGSRWKYVPTPVDPKVVTFGYGRRFCPGRDLALMEFWYTVATTLQLFTISSRESPPKPMADHRILTTSVSHPDDFECIIKPRSQKAENLIRNLDRTDIALSFL